MSMRKALAETLFQIQETNNKAVVLLGDIGVFGFQKSFIHFPKRTINLGILEQSTVSVAAGLARAGMIPVVHTIAPFLVERAFEQIKIDFGYQALSGKFVSVGASYDYAALGCTHHCPGDIAVLKTIPDLEIVVPGTAHEFSTLLKESFTNGLSTYFRLSEIENAQSQNLRFGKATVMKKGRLGTIIAVGPFLDRVMEATHDLDVTVLYTTTLSPFDTETLRLTSVGRKIIVISPFYEGSLSHDIISAFGGQPITLHDLSMPRKFLRHYGHRSEHDEALGLTASALHRRIHHILKSSKTRSIQEEILQ